MWSFFMMLFGIICLCIVYRKDNKGKREYQTKVDENKIRSDKWFAKVDHGPLNNYNFYEKLKCDYEFRNTLYKECNEILDSIPEMCGIRINSMFEHKSTRIMEMMYNARTGDVSIMWFRGFVILGDITEGLTSRPSPNGCAAFIAWYQKELRKNGYPDAIILPVHNNYGHVVAWRFVDGVTTLDMIKRELFIN